MIYSIVSENDIFLTNEVSQPVFEKINGGMIEINTTNGIKQIKRLYSTNPHLYLDKRYLPYNNI